jgi:hypothetical protein
MVKMEKRGVIEIQMHWIFVIIAGALILVFFIGLAVRQRGIARTELIFDIENDLNLLIQVGKAAEGSVSEIDMPELEINFGCRDYWIEGQKKSLGAKPVFANDKIISDKLVLWSRAWKMPFKVDTFLYMTSPRVRFVFFNIPASLYDDLPDAISKEKASELANLADNGNYKIKFVIFNKKASELGFPAWLRKYDVTAVSVFTDSRKIQYYSFRGNLPELQGETSYLGDESMAGAFFTDNIEDYNCIMDKAMAELNAVSKIYLEKTKLLDESNVCPLFYGDTNTGLLAELASKSAKSFSRGTVNVQDIEGTANSIQAMNYDIEIQSCPPIY